MHKYIILIMTVASLSACAGNPPAWWNPGNIYSPPKQKQSAENTLPPEQTISLQDETYEEMVLTPLQDEENENSSGDAASQTLPQEDLLPPSILN